MQKASARKTSARKNERGSSKPIAPTVYEAAGIVALIVAAVWVFWPSLHGEWLMNWDDNFMVVDNRNLRDAGGLWNIWGAAPGADYWPLSSTFLWIEWHLFGNQPLGYHLCNLALHILSGLLLWCLLARLGLRWGWLGGALFVVHPLTVESVAWVSEVKNTLSLPFFLLAALAYLDFNENGNTASYIKSILLYIAAMLSKTSVVMLPPVLLLYCWWKSGRISTRDFKRITPFFSVALLLGCITVAMQAPSPISDIPRTRAPWEIFLTAGQAIYFYLGSFLAPFRPTLIYPRWNLAAPSPLQLLLWPLLVVLLLLLSRVKPWGRHVLLGLGFFLLTLAPVLGFIHFTYMRYSWVADHFAYLPIVGLIGLLVAGIEYLHALTRPAHRGFVMAGVVALLLAWSFQTYGYAQAFASEQALWKVTLARNPEAVPAYNNLGLDLMHSSDLWGARGMFERAIQVRPDFVESRCNLGVTLFDLGDVAGGIGQLDAARQINPNYAVTYYDLGTIDLRLGRAPEAIAQLETAVKLDPHSADAQENLGYALSRQGQPESAVEHLRAALVENPDNASAHFYLGAALMDLRRYPEAVAELEAALRLAPHMVQAQQMLAKAQALGGA